MDIISLIGIAIALGSIVAGQFLEGGTLATLLQPTAFVIVVGGTLGAVMLQSPWRVFWRGLSMFWWVWFPPRIYLNTHVQQIAGWSYITRREGLLALESVIDQVQDPFLRKGLILLVDGADASRLSDVLEVDIQTYENELIRSARIWESAGGYAPTLGILGAVIGLIQVMQNLTDPERLGAGIATAFVATIYGVGFANLFFVPIAAKLKANIAQLVNERELIVDGLAALANGDNPRIIESRLQGYLS